MSNEKTLFYLKSGERVIIDKNSHVHDQAKKYLITVLNKIISKKRKIIHEIIKFDHVIGYSYCVKTNKNDEIVFAKRKDRNFYNRFVKNKQPEKSKEVVIILQKLNNTTYYRYEQTTYRIVTAFVGKSPISKRWLMQEDFIREYNLLKKIEKAFWETHALVFDEFNIDKNSIKTPDEFLHYQLEKDDKSIHDNPPKILGKLKSGETVIDRFKSTVDKADYKEYAIKALSKIDSKKEKFIETTVEFDHFIDYSIIVKINPHTDKDFFAKRPKKFGHSHFVSGKSPEPTKKITIVLKKIQDNRYLLVTAYPGSKKPVEPWNMDYYNKKDNPRAEQRKAIKFWWEHAFVEGIIPFQKDTVAKRPPKK